MCREKRGIRKEIFVCFVRAPILRDHGTLKSRPLSFTALTATKAVPAEFCFDHLSKEMKSIDMLCLNMILTISGEEMRVVVKALEFLLVSSFPNIRLSLF